MWSGLQAANFQILFPLINDFDGQERIQVSEDGSKVLATHSSDTNTVFLWEQGRGVTTVWNDNIARLGMSGDGNKILETVPPYSFVAYDASYDGSVVAGYRDNHPSGIINGAEIDLGQLSPVNSAGVATAVSSDGATIVGWMYGPGGYRAFRWNAESGMRPLGGLPNAVPHAEAFDVSANGSVIVGQSYDANRNFVAFRWTESTGMQSLGDLPGGDFFSQAYAVSANGRVIVGEGSADDDIGGAYDLPPEAFIWTEAGGMHDLRDMLIHGYGLELDEYRRAATAISANGNVIVGWGSGPGMANLSAWRVNLIPEPSALAQLASIALIVFIRKNRNTT
jgi:probable HAF family extracellular repeat protein